MKPLWFGMKVTPEQNRKIKRLSKGHRIFHRIRNIWKDSGNSRNHADPPRYDISWSTGRMGSGHSSSSYR